MRLPRLISCVLLTAMLAIFAMPAAAQAGFGTIIKGPLGVGGCPHSGPAMGMDSSVGQVYGCGPGAWLPASVTVNVQGAQTALTNVTTAQTMWTYTPPAGLFNFVGRVWEVCGEAMFSNGATAPQITIGVKVGASVTPVSVISAANANTNTNAPLNFCFRIQTAATGASGTDEAHGWLTDATAAAWAAGTAVSTYVDGNTALSSAYDHTAANAIAVQITSTATLTSVTPRFLHVSLIL